MINRKDVIRIKVPFPTIDSRLAIESHMYICRRADNGTFGFVKCQPLKPYMLTVRPILHYWDEKPDIERNPFQKTTRIDCDKEFVTCSVQYDDRLKTDSRPDVCEEVMEHIEYELVLDGYVINNVSEKDLVSLNRLVREL